MSFDFDAAVSAPFRMQPGPRRLAPGARQLTPNIASHDALVSMRPAVLEDRGLAAVPDRLMRWLAARASR